jgi:hypothetical protein
VLPRAEAAGLPSTVTSRMARTRARSATSPSAPVAARYHVARAPADQADDGAAGCCLGDRVEEGQQIALGTSRRSCGADDVGAGCTAPTRPPAPFRQRADRPNLPLVRFSEADACGSPPTHLRRSICLRYLGQGR